MYYCSVGVFCFCQLCFQTWIYPQVRHAKPTPLSCMTEDSIAYWRKHAILWALPTSHMLVSEHSPFSHLHNAPPPPPPPPPSTWLFSHRPVFITSYSMYQGCVLYVCPNITTPRCACEGSSDCSWSMGDSEPLDIFQHQSTAYLRTGDTRLCMRH